MDEFARPLHPFSFLVSSPSQPLCSKIHLAVVGNLLSWDIQYGQTLLLLQRAYLLENIIEDFVSHLSALNSWEEQYLAHGFQLLSH
jgi:hypothetical protein